MPLRKTRLTGQTQISRLLTHLQDLQVKVHIDGAGITPQQTQILAVNADAQHLLVDRVRLRPGQPLPAPGRILTLEAEFHGESATFSAPIVEAADLAGQALLRLRLPTEVAYRQRRGYYRVSIEQDPPVHLTLIDEDEGSLFGVVEDISLGGLGARIRLPAGDTAIRAELCLIQLHGGQVFHSELEITNSRGLDAGEARIGARFRNPGESQLRKLERFIRQREREQLRRRTE